MAYSVKSSDSSLGAHFCPPGYRDEKELPAHADVFISSANRIVTGTDTTTSFQTVLAKPIMNVEKLSLVYFIINKSVYNVTASNQWIDFNDGTARSVQIPIGSYTASTLATQVATSMNAVSTNWSCTISSTTFLTTISRSSGTSNVLFGTGTHASTSLASLLGFAAADLTGTAASFTGTTAVDLSAPNFAFIKISELGHTSTTNGTLTDFAFCVPIIGNTGTIVFYQNTDSECANTIRCPKTNLRTLTITVTDNNNAPLNLNGGNWQMLIRCYSKSAH